MWTSARKVSLTSGFSVVMMIKTIFTLVLQGVSKKRYFLDFLSYFSSRGRILLFHMCFGIRILSPFHLAIQKVSIQNLNCPKNAKNACADMIFIPAQSSLRKGNIFGKYCGLNKMDTWHNSERTKV